MGTERKGVWAAGLGLALILLCGCREDVERTAAAMTGGDPHRGLPVYPPLKARRRAYFVQVRMARSVNTVFPRIVNLRIF